MTTFYPIELVCPVCETEFTSQEVGSCGHASKRTDFRPNYWGANPVSYFYHDCPECGFCGIKNYYKKQIESEEFKEEIKGIEPLKKDSNNSILFSKIKRAMSCLEAMNEHQIININEFALANNWMNAFWWANNSEDLKNAGEIVLKYFAEAFQKGQVPENQILVVMYLRGEINRRMGNTEKAEKFFDRVLKLVKEHEDPNNIASLAEQQKNDPQEHL
jgi:uncharacterized protein (DUF2225 family)